MRRHMDWSPLVPADHLALLRTYGFDKEGMRRLRNRKVAELERAISKLPTFATVPELEAFFRGHLPPSIDFAAYFQPIAARFAERWERRARLAEREVLYQTSAPHKRRLDAILEVLHANKRARVTPLV